jgi:hypothetical protein
MFDYRRIPGYQKISWLIINLLFLGYPLLGKPLNQAARLDISPTGRSVHCWGTVKNYGKSPFLMGKSTISTGPFSIGTR